MKAYSYISLDGVVAGKLFIHPFAQVLEITGPSLMGEVFSHFAALFSLQAIQRPLKQVAVP